MTEEKRNSTLDVYKGLLIIIVVVRHILQFSVSDEGGILTNILWAIQMPGFMLVSGYFGAKACNSKNELLQSIRKSIIRYAIPFFSWFVLVNILLLGNYQRNIIKGLGVLINRVDNGLWFLWTIFILSVIASIDNYCYEKKQSPVKGLFVVILLTIVLLGIFLIIAMIQGINFLGTKYILYYSVFYFYGWVIRKTEKQPQIISIIHNKGITLVCGILFAFIVLNFDLYHCEDNILNITLRLVSGFCGNCILINLVYLYAEQLKKTKLAFIGRYTLEIYVTHVYFCSLFADNNYPFMTVNGFLNFLFSLSCTIFFSFLLICTIKGIPVLNFVFFGKKK